MEQQQQVSWGFRPIIAPEQASGSKVGKAADVYSFGCTMYHMLTGAVPFETKSMYELCDKHCNAQAIPVETKRQDVPKEFAELVKKCMEKDPTKRPTLAEVKQQLSHVKQQVTYKQSIYSEEGKQYLREKFGEIKLLRWWDFRTYDFFIS